MNEDSIKIPIEYYIVRLHDWTEFRIAEGGW